MQEIQHPPSSNWLFLGISPRKGWKCKTKESDYGQIHVLEKIEQAYKYCKKCNILVLCLCEISAKNYQEMNG
jgi:hypothetical protein